MPPHARPAAGAIDIKLRLERAFHYRQLFAGMSTTLLDAVMRTARQGSGNSADVGEV
jgi:hypothetical protein